uniref:Uncharacterized protein n=1 Tax=Arundo donax TaxID=35708 RepID=A0A0A9EMC9_ARUDO
MLGCSPYQVSQLQRQKSGSLFHSSKSQRLVAYTSKSGKAEQKQELKTHCKWLAQVQQKLSSHFKRDHKQNHKIRTCR